MKKKVFVIILILAMIMAILQPICFALYEFDVVGENFKYDVYDEYIHITGYIGKSEDVIIPEEIDGKSVTRINRGIFIDCNVTSVTIPNSEKIYIEQEAFSFCNSLESINVDIDNKNYCSKDGVLFNKDMTEIICYPSGKKDAIYTIPDTVVKICNRAFGNCPNLITINIPKSVKDIEQDDFSSNQGRYAITSTNLESINVDVDNENYSSEDGVLFNKNKTELILYPREKKDLTYIIPNSVEHLYTISFCNTNLKELTIPISVNRFTAHNLFSFPFTYGCTYTVYIYKDSAAEILMDETNMCWYPSVIFKIIDEEETLLGDINGDGKVTMFDCSEVLLHVKKIKLLTGAALESADVNGDGKVTMFDCSEILLHVKKVKFIKKLYIF